MTNSMTAFARTQQSLDEGDLIWEVRSVNHRYLELHMKIPEAFRASEMQLRELLQRRLKRGKVECFLRFNPRVQQTGEININEQHAKSLIKACHDINNLWHQPSEVNVLQVLQWPGVVNEQQLDMKAVLAASEQSLALALDELTANRKREGERMAEFITQRCQAVKQIVDDTRKNVPDIIQRYEQKLRDRIAALAIDVSADRLEQELVHMTQKMDVDEELDRLDSHLEEMAEVLAREEPVGRRLDFIMQELNREANTLGSKSADISSTNASVELKVMIEQMREQIQNIE